MLAILGPNGAGKTALFKMYAEPAGRRLPTCRRPSRALFLHGGRKWSCLEIAAASARFQRHRRRISVRRALPSSVSNSHLFGRALLRAERRRGADGADCKGAFLPTHLVLDEPESNLDFKNQLLVLDTIEELTKSGLTCIFNTHFPAHALRRRIRPCCLAAAGKASAGKHAML